MWRGRSKDTTPANKISSSRFYGEYSGHKVTHLQRLYPLLRSNCDSLIWTAGDSSLDNKYWFHDPQPSVGVYADLLEPPTSNADITYWMNLLCQQRQQQQQQQQRQGNDPSFVNRAVINTAVEATTLNERTFRLRPQDRFIRDHIQENDTLIVSVGGNDVALAPLPCTIAAIVGLICLPTTCLENGHVGPRVPCDDYCCGCGSSLASCAGSCPPCFGYMAHLFGTRVQKYIERLTSKTRPKQILICMIYYLDENVVPSWAGPALGVLGYNSNPAKLQLLIRKFFVHATSTITIPGTDVIPVPLFQALDGTNSADYVARVEPSPQGGRKIAELLLDAIENGSAMANGGVLSPSMLSATSPLQPVEAQYMSGRQ